MPIRISVGLTKKVGLPHYSSLGATCSVEIELDHAALDGNLERFHQHVRRTYLACAASVQDELDRQLRNPDGADLVTEPEASRSEEPPPTTPPANEPSSNSPLASPRQLNFARRLATQISGLGIRRLEGLVMARFQTPLAALSNVQASNLIELLRQLRAGKVTIEDSDWAAAER